MKVLDYKHNHNQLNHHSTTIGSTAKSEFSYCTRVDGTIQRRTETKRSPQLNKSNYNNTTNLKDMNALFFKLNKKK